jgi:sugar transferase (PEP-CTERM/EpsH1 system associated)
MSGESVSEDLAKAIAIPLHEQASRNPLLFLCHRMPYPPNKGDKVRSFHLLEHLASRYRVFLGTFVDDPHDCEHVERIQRLCAGVCVQAITPVVARIFSLSALAKGVPLSVAYYRNPALTAWVREVVRRERIKSALVFSSPMFQFVAGLRDLHVVTDFVDVDSMKWTQYAAGTRAGLSWLYRREGERLLAYEREAAARSAAALFVTDAEARLFRRLAPECADRTRTVENGVDIGYFDPEIPMQSPYPAGEQAIVFTGAMDYRPNVEAVTWFAEHVLSAVARHRPETRFYVVGARPTRAVLALRDKGVVVTGGVPDIRPFIRHAAVAVAPLRIARGVQNKVLEAMAMERAVVVSREAAVGIDAVAGRDFVVAGTASQFAESIGALLADPAYATALGSAARMRVNERYSWGANLARLGIYLQKVDARQPAARVPCASSRPLLS